MKVSLILISLLIISLTSLSQTDNLFVITEGKKYGYIDREGKEIIAPVFKHAGNFAEGLAAVRLNGRYGYIDRTGKLVLPDKYDLAYDFQYGIACVYIDGQPRFIDKSGEVILDTVYKSIDFVSANIAIVKDGTGKSGLINLTAKKLITKLIYDGITRLDNGVAVVFIRNEKGYEKDYAVIDTFGNYVVPFGIYEEINNFNEGHSVVSRMQKNGDKIGGVIDTKGNLLFQRKNENRSYLSDYFYSGFAVLNLYKHWNSGYSSANQYNGYINLKGEIVLNDTLNQFLKNFSEGRVFIKSKSGKYRLFDENLNEIGGEFDNVKNHRFYGGYAIVKEKHEWGVIDTNGRYVVKPGFDYIDEIGIVNGYFFYSMDEDFWGVAHVDGTIIMKPVLQQYDRNGFKNGLLKTIINDRLSYVDTIGNIIWQEKKSSIQMFLSTDIDYMNRGYFYASSKSHENDLGGFGGSGNGIKLIDDRFPGKSTFYVTVNTHQIDTIQKIVKAYEVRVINQTDADIHFNAQDSRLYMVVQAKNNNGDWQDIEYLPSSWCGNSYHILTLQSDQYWSFLTPVYDGELKTKLRIKLEYINPKAKKKGIRSKNTLITYSNEYDGGVNPGQFWNKRNYYPAGLMDPYYD